MDSEKVIARKAASVIRARKSFEARKAAGGEDFMRAHRAKKAEQSRVARARAPDELKRKRAEQAKQWRLRKGDEYAPILAAKTREWRLNNPEKDKESKARWRSKNAEKVRASALRNWHRRQLDPAHALRSRISALVRASLRRGKKTQSIADCLDFTVDELRVHLERQFLPEMGWHNRREWHVDHILPLSSFTFTTDQDEQFKRAWSLTNLRPLWSSDNVRKYNHITHLL